MMNEELETMLKYLRLPSLLANWSQYLKMSAKGNLSHASLLEYIIQQEYSMKKENSRVMRIARAKIPQKYVIETYPFLKQKKLNKKKILALYDSFEYMEKQQNLIFIGPPGVGKTGLATSFLTQAINKGYNGRFIVFPKLISELYSSIADHSEAQVLKKFVSYDCLQVDELGFVEMEPAQVGMFFTLMSERYKKKTTLITSNLGFSQWGTFLKNDQLTAALLSRLTETSYVINMLKCDPIREILDKSEFSEESK